jgi:hypothetical protein
MSPKKLKGVAHEGATQSFKKGGKTGLWDNIHAKRARIKAGSGEKMRQPGEKGAPTAKAIRASQTSRGGKNRKA